MKTSQTVSDATGGDQARTTSSTYDVHDQQTSVTDALGNKSTFGYDAYGNMKNSTLLDYFMPTAVETPVWETDHTTTPSPHHPIGAKGVGESPNVGGVSAFSNAVNDAFAHLGLTHTQMPHDHWRVWKTAQSLGLTAG